MPGPAQSLTPEKEFKLLDLAEAIMNSALQKCEKLGVTVTRSSENRTIDPEHLVYYLYYDNKKFKGGTLKKSRRNFPQYS